MLMTVPSVPYRIKKICLHAEAERNTTVFFQGFAPVFGTQMHPGFNRIHFFSTEAVSLPINVSSFFSYNSSVIEDGGDLFTVPYRNFFFGVEVESADSHLQVMVNHWRAAMINYTDLMHWMLRPVYALGRGVGGAEMEVPFTHS